MSRSTQFSTPVHQQVLEKTPGPPKDGTVKGPVSFLNPTRANFDLPAPAEATARTEVSGKDAYRVEWRARDNRKGRHILVVPPTHAPTEPPRITSSSGAIAQGVWRMITVWAWWDVSWWIAVLFTYGSAIFAVSSFFYWLPLAAPSITFHDESLVAGGVMAFIGATLFTVGGVLLIVEASNENQTGCFGWAVEHLFVADDTNGPEAEKQASEVRSQPNACKHHHHRGLHHGVHLQHPEAGRKWEWAPTRHELTSHYLREIGFLGSFIMAIGAVVFYVSGIMALPGIYNKISTPVLWGTYWLAYLVGGVLFTVSSLLYVLETQKKWWLPAPKVLGWWIGVFNLTGSVGWVLSASFGYCSPSWCAYQSNLSTLWASFAFLFGSLLLWYEALDKYPVYRAKA
ncbi:hypothetical protein M409DRAFT_31059 [Zasmidium cellare ATCC 36951]|uniref:Uncharacterized protein n=1 Tax=Zasmidium cellare ATCC 36951 TaxID=1080233 RepID=A0A6A6BUF1_ZASCE|nr:uncharacterized protein M409DRAFT_31059 [Zasmidium cellare ATCC 36951]KAF2158427.1 hypothetical protein M409DRAFT_31059 [Zasmidium cellare ATCC 36951]